MTANKRKSKRAAVFVALLGAAQLGTADTQCGPELRRSSLGKLVQQGKDINNAPFLPHRGMRFLRPRLQLLSDTDQPWTLVVRAGDGRPIQNIDRATVPLNKSFWTLRVPGEMVRFDLIAGEQKPKIELVEYVAMPSQSKNTFYSIVKDESRPTNLYAAKMPVGLGDPVGMLVANAPSSTAATSWCCSGFALTDKLFITNWHCGAEGVQPENAWGDDVSASALIDFSWDGDDRPNDYRIMRVAAQSQKLDYAILEIAPLSGAQGVRPAALRFTKPNEGEDLQVVQHPACQTKQISQSCTVRKADGTGVHGEFYHDCGTHPGSSGSPVYDDAGLVVGLHHDGQAFDEKCQPKDSVNRAITMVDILADLEHQAPDIATSIREYQRRAVTLK